MSLLALALACTGETDPDSVNFLLEERDAGASLAEGTGYDFDSPQMAVFGAQHVVPGLSWDNSPPTEQILLLWEHLQGENISDPGTCPALMADGAETTWFTNCRSQDGYDWSGSVVKVSWEEAGQDWEHWTFDVEVAANAEERSFRTISLEGQFYFAGTDGDQLLSRTQANLRIQADGYWESGFKDELEEAWLDYAVTGQWETQDLDGQRTFQVEGALDLSDHGGFRFVSDKGFEQQGASCVGEPKGLLELDSGSHTAALRYEGAARCDLCAEYSLDGEDVSLACDPFWF